MAISIPSVDSIREFVRYVPVTAFKAWLNWKGKTFSTLTQANYASKINKWITKGDLTNEELDEAVYEIEETGGKKVFLKFVSGQFPTSKREFDAFLQEKAIPQVARKRRSVRNPQSPTLNHIVWEESTTPAETAIVVKYSELHEDVQLDVEAAKTKLVQRPVFIVFKLYVNSGLLEVRFDNPGDRHSHKDSDGKSSSQVMELHYFDRFSDLFTRTIIEQFGLSLVARFLAREGAEIFRLNRDASTITGNGKQIYSCAGSADVRELPARIAAAQEDGDNWVTDDITGYWKADGSGGVISTDLFMRMSQNDALRFQRDCIGIELDYAIGKIREIKERTRRTT